MCLKFYVKTWIETFRAATSFHHFIHLHSTQKLIITSKVRKSTININIRIDLWHEHMHFEQLIVERLKSKSYLIRICWAFYNTVTCFIRYRSLDRSINSFLKFFKFIQVQEQKFRNQQFTWRKLIVEFFLYIVIITLLPSIFTSWFILEHLFHCKLLWAFVILWNIQCIL